MTRKRIDEVRKILVDSFMSGDMDTYKKAVFELEDLIGVPHGERSEKPTLEACLVPQKRGGSKSKVSAKVAEDVLRLAESGNSYRNVAKELGISKDSVFRIVNGRRQLDVEHIGGTMTWTVRYDNPPASTAKSGNQSR